MELGDSALEACARQVFEATGLEVEIVRLIGVYTSPHFIIEYDDGNRIQQVDLCFEAEVTGGEFRPNSESTEVGYFSLDELKTIDVWEAVSERIADAFTGQEAAIVR